MEDTENVYEVKVTFLDEDEHTVDFIYFPQKAYSVKEAYKQIENEIEDNPDLYRYADYEMKLVAVY